MSRSLSGDKLVNWVFRSTMSSYMPPNTLIDSNLLLLLLLFLCTLQLDRYQQKVLKRENSIAVLCKTKVARMLFIIVTAFVLLHIPFTVVVFMRQTLLQNALMNQVDGLLYLLSCVSHYFLYLNAAINPIIYGLTNDNFRRAYHQTPIWPRFNLAKLSRKVKHHFGLPSIHIVDTLILCAHQFQSPYGRTKSIKHTFAYIALSPCIYGCSLFAFVFIAQDNLMKRPNTRTQPIVFRLTQETELSPTSNKSKCPLSTTWSRQIVKAKHENSYIYIHSYFCCTIQILTNTP